MPDGKRSINRGSRDEGDDLIRLGNLLHMERREAEKASLEGIMRSDLSIREKIRRIEELDRSASERKRKERAPPRRQGADKLPEKVPAPRREEDSVPPEMRPEPERSQIHIKRPHTTLSYMSFLFREYRRILSFGRQSRTMLPVLFPPGLRMIPDLGTSLSGNLQPVSAKVLEILIPVLEVGWLYLEKEDYNLLVQMKRLCVEICATKFQMLNYREKRLINRLRTLEALFLTLQYKTEYPKRIVLAAEKVIRAKQTVRVERSTLAGPVKKILSSRELQPSLYNVLLALNMRKSRRYFIMDDLIRKSGGGIIDKTGFDCDPQIGEKIGSYTKKSLNTLRDLHRKKKEIQRQKQYLPTDEQGTPDFSELRLFYNAGQYKERYDYITDRENTVLFIPRFLQIFTHCFEDLLNRKIRLLETGKTELFSRSFFQIEFKKLNYLVSRMDSLVISFPHFPLHRYLSIKSSKTGPISVESEFMQLSEEAMVHLLNIAGKLNAVLIQRSKEERGTEALAPDILQGKPFTLPYENVMIESETAINGITVLQALTTAISVILLFGIEIADTNALTLLKMEGIIDGKIHSVMDELERIADRETLLEIKGWTPEN